MIRLFKKCFPQVINRTNDEDFEIDIDNTQYSKIVEKLNENASMIGRAVILCNIIISLVKKKRWNLKAQ